MKTNRVFLVQLVAALLLAATNTQLSTAHAQGALTPPGAPVPTMKSLDQVYARLDPRTAITNSSSGYIINVPGSYYLTTNLTVSSGNGIAINISGVTLDLNGFTISSTAASASYAGVSVAGPFSDVIIVNGHIRSGVTNNGSGVYSGSGFATGIGHTSTALTNTMVSKVSVMGVSGDGINLGVGGVTVVEACTVTTAGNWGIVASTINGSVATGCGNAAILGDQVVDCRGSSIAGSGVTATAAALNCYGSSSNSFGLWASTAENCWGQSGSGEGLHADLSAQNCCGKSSSSYGLHAYTAQNCFGQTVSGTGLYAHVASNCRGDSSGIGTGLSAYMANTCYGNSTSGTGLSATYGNFCFGSSVSVANKYNMP